MSEAESASDRTQQEEHAERVRDAFRQHPGFLDTLRSAQADVQAGRVIDQEELLRRFPAED